MTLLTHSLRLALAVGVSAAAVAYEGDAVIQQFLAPPDAAIVVGSPLADVVVSDVVARAKLASGESHHSLLPVDATVDRVTWRGDLLEIELTVPIADGWGLTPIDVETLAGAFGRPFLADGRFAGVDVRVRTGVDAAYGGIEQLLPTPPADAEQPQREIDPPFLAVKAPQRAGGELNFGGPSIHAARQPTGALSGVTVFCSAGHGWTAGSSDWYLQRPVLLDMIEDYGNLDQLNYFVQYAFNAGATVVPMRPVGWQDIEIVLDQDDAGVTYTGAWADGGGSKYYENGVTNSGVPYRYATVDTVSETATARFSPTITVTDFYPVYAWALASTNRTLQTYRVGHSGGVSEVAVDHREVGSGWIFLGWYHLTAGGDNYVEVSNLAPDAGVVIADAVRFGGGFGDVVGDGPGTTSGYPRDEEAQRYWAESEFGNNAAGFPSSIWDSSSSDASDNVGAGARMAREMNQVPAGGVLDERWRRIHIEFHTNASGGGARGQICLITTSGETTYQSSYANTLSNEVDADMLVIDNLFEHSWVDRSSATYTSAYGAISTTNNSNEFDATIVELAFHDNQQDAELLRDARVRSAMARAVLHGIIRFLHSLPGSQVPLDFPPDTPRFVRVSDLGNGSVRVAWEPPLIDGARGDEATGYVVYQSSNGFGFGDPVIVSSGTTADIAVPAGELRYFRVAATNPGGESMPTEVLAVRRPTSGVADVLIVNGFDRLERTNNPVDTFTQPPAYAGDSFERQQWRRSNAFDYIVEHATALADGDFGFVSCSNDAVINSYVVLDTYGIVDWILGNESVNDATLSGSEQIRIETFLDNGGAIFVSGSELGYDLIGNGNGINFMTDVLRTGYVGDSAATYTAQGESGSILDGVGSFSFSPGSGARLDAEFPDQLSTGADASVCARYVGGSGGVAGVQYTGVVYNSVAFGFPFETIASAGDRATVMSRVMEFLATAQGPLPFDQDHDNDVDWIDFLYFTFCDQGPNLPPYPQGHLCNDLDGDADFDTDMIDYALMQAVYTGEL